MIYMKNGINFLVSNQNKVQRVVFEPPDPGDGHASQFVAIGATFGWKSGN